MFSSSTRRRSESKTTATGWRLAVRSRHREAESAGMTLIPSTCSLAARSPRRASTGSAQITVTSRIVVRLDVYAWSLRPCPELGAPGPPQLRRNNESCYSQGVSMQASTFVMPPIETSAVEPRHALFLVPMSENPIRCSGVHLVVCGSESSRRSPARQIQR